MKPYRRHILNTAICFLLPQGLFFGCSLIGLGIGTISDNASNRNAGDISLMSIRKLEPGTTLTVITRDSRRLEGDYAGSRETPQEPYQAQYEQALVKLGMKDHFPLPGDTITFGTYFKPETKLRGIFMGVDPGVAVVSRAGQRVAFLELAWMHSPTGADIDLEAFQTLVSDRQLPSVTQGILLCTDSDTTEILLSDVIRVEKEASHNGKLIGFGIGAVIDIAVIVGMSQAHHESEESCNRTSTNQGCNARSR
jgi:hypothetical protein